MTESLSSLARDALRMRHKYPTTLIEAKEREEVPEKETQELQEDTATAVVRGLDGDPESLGTVNHHDLLDPL